MGYLMMLNELLDWVDLELLFHHSFSIQWIHKEKSLFSLSSSSGFVSLGRNKVSESGVLTFFVCFQQKRNACYLL